MSETIAMEVTGLPPLPQGYSAVKLAIPREMDMYLHPVHGWVYLATGVVLSDKCIVAYRKWDASQIKVGGVYKTRDTEKVFVIDDLHKYHTDTNYRWIVVYGDGEVSTVTQSGAYLDGEGQAGRDIIGPWVDA